MGKESKKKKIKKLNGNKPDHHHRHVLLHQGEDVVAPPTT